MNVCMYLCMRVCMNVYMCVCIYVYMNVCIYACMYVCMYVYMYICVYACMYVCMYVQCRHLIPALNAWANLRIIHDRTPDCHCFFCMEAWVTSQLNVDSIRKLRGSIMPLGHAFTCLTRMSVQPGTGRRPVDMCRN